MRNWLLAPILALPFLLTFSTVSIAQSAQPSGASKATTKDQLFDKHDFSGIWDNDAHMSPKDQINVHYGGGQQPPFTAWGRSQFAANNTDIKYGVGDPIFKCDPMPVSRDLFAPRPFEIFSIGGRLIQHFEYYDVWREIWTDGRPVPTDPDPNVLGTWVGKWEGDTFVVEGVGFIDDKSWLDGPGHPHSDALHEIEHWRRINHDTLEIKVTIEDSKTYTQPWTVTEYYKLKPKNFELKSQRCNSADEARFGDVIGVPATNGGLKSWPNSDSNSDKK
jgi:hypothetical protein